MKWFPLSSLLDAQILWKVKSCKTPILESSAPSTHICITPVTWVVAEKLRHSLLLGQTGQRDTGLTSCRVPSIQPGREHIVYLPSHLRYPRHPSDTGLLPVENNYLTNCAAFRLYSFHQILLDFCLWKRYKNLFLACLNFYNL